MKEHFMVVTEGKYFLFIKLQQKNIQRKMSHTANSKVHKHFFICIANYLRILNTRAFTWHENMLVYLYLDIICSSKLTVLL